MVGGGRGWWWWVVVVVVCKPILVVSLSLSQAEQLMIDDLDLKTNFLNLIMYLIWVSKIDIYIYFKYKFHNFSLNLKIVK